MNEDDRSKISSAVQAALLSAAKLAVGPLRQLRVVTNQKSGNIQAFARLLVVEKVVNQHEEISILDAQRMSSRVKIGEEVEVDVTPDGFARVATRAAKQALMDHLRRAEEGGEGR